nr:hexose transporter [Gongronella sp. w5]
MKETFDEAVSYQHREASGLKGLLDNPYVLGTSAFAAIGGVLFGYDQGIISGIQEMETFKARFPMNATENGMVVSILTLGCWVGSLIVGYFSDKIGRKYSIALYGVVFLIGSAVQTAAMDVNYLLAGRFVAGLSIGGLSMLVPLYQSELAPASIRGSLVSLQQLAVTFGILISFWIDYGCQYIQSEAQWRVPFGIQIALGLLLIVGILFFPFSPRWLMSQGREDEALATLAKLRRLPASHPRVQEEFRDIKINVKFEKMLLNTRFPELAQEDHKVSTWTNIKVGASLYADCFKKGIFIRLFIGCALQFFQQFSGINAIIYYAPRIMQSVGLTGNSISLLATGVIGIINFLSTFITVLYVDRVGRRVFLMVAAVAMTVCMVVIAVIVGLFEDDWPNHTAAGWTAVAFVYLYIANFAYSFGPLGWVIPAEMFPLRIRSKAMSITTSANWMNNFIIGLITPIMLETIRYKTYVFFAIFCFLAFFFAAFVVKETKNRSLEDMDALFGGNSAAEDNALLEQVKKEENSNITVIKTAAEKEEA